MSEELVPMDLSGFRNVVGIPDYMIDSAGTVITCKKRWGQSHWRPMAPCTTKSGHLMVSLTMNGKQYPRLVHRLVLEAFVGPRPSGMECCHNDGNPANNNLNNLRWDTRKSNVADALRLGTMLIGTKNGQSKLDDEKVIAIRKRYAEGNITMQKLADMYEVRISLIHGIIAKTRWAHLN